MQKKKIILYIVLGLFICGAFVSDCFINIDINLSGSNFIGVALSFLTIIFTLWFSYLLMVKQIYSNRYSNRVVSKYIYKGRKLLTVHFFVLLVIGFFLLVFADDYVISSLCYVLNCILFIFLCGKNIYKKLSEEEIKNAIKDKVDFILNEIDKNTEPENVRKEILKLKRIYDDAYLKNEISTCLSVLICYYEFFKKYIETRNKNIINDDKKTKDTLELLVVFHKELLKSDNSSFASELNENILHTFYKIAELSIKCRTTFSRVVAIIFFSSNFGE